MDGTANLPRSFYSPPQTAWGIYGTFQKSGPRNFPVSVLGNLEGRVKRLYDLPYYSQGTRLCPARRRSGSNFSVGYALLIDAVSPSKPLTRHCADSKKKKRRGIRERLHKPPPYSLS